MSVKSFATKLFVVMATVGCMFSAANAQGCKGTAYVKVPSSWSSVYVYLYYHDNLVPETAYDAATGFYAINLGTLTTGSSLASTFIVHTSVSGYTNIDYPGVWGISGSVYDGVVQGRPTARDIACPGEGQSIYVMEDPLNPGHTYVGTVPADARYLYVKVPQNADWLWSTPMVREVGSSTGKAMTPVPDRCGWFFAVWDAASLPENAEIYDAAGHTFGAASLPLSLTLSGDVTKIYYDADRDALTETDPKTNGSCISNGGTRFYFLAPDDKDWVSATPMLSSDGGATGTAMRPAPNMCGWYYMEWNRGSIPPDEVYIYSSDNPEKKIGFMGLSGGEDYPIPLRDFFMSWSNNIYFIPDDNWWPEGTEDSYGFFAVDPLVDGVCGFSLAALIYDTDQSLNPLFTSDGDNGGFGACTGVRHGIVKQDLGPDNKPVFNDGNTNAIICAGDEEKFSTLFNYTEGVNEVQCYDMPFRHYGTDPRWGFDSDSAASLFGGYSGFHPIENTTDATVIKSLGPEPCSVCRTKRYSQGPVPYTYTGDFDKYCNTYGWDGGVECEGKFNNGDSPAVWDWGATRWSNTSGHNQQFCFESHAAFTYREDQEFTFRGDDDIWVFINKKLALDNGGAHLAAPGHVVLKKLNDTYTPDCSGNDCLLVPGKEYPLDIFFCDRRTTMSNVIIKTNMFIRQTGNGSDAANDVTFTERKNNDGSVTYDACLDQNGSLTCASIASGQQTIHACGSNIKKYGKTLAYSITDRSGNELLKLKSGVSGAQYGGIYLANPYVPKINVDKISGLDPGSYRLAIDVCDKKDGCHRGTYVNFRVSGSLDVVTKNVSFLPIVDEEKNSYYKEGTKWTYVGEGLAGKRVPVYVSALMGNEVDLNSAVGQSYTLTLDQDAVAYTSEKGDTKVTWPRKVGKSGIDTVWIYIDRSKVSSMKVVSVTLKSSAKIKFVADEKDLRIRERALQNTGLTFSVSGREIQIRGSYNGTPYAVFDMQGRIVKKGVVLSVGTTISLPHAGTYLIYSGKSSSTIRVR